MLEAMINESRLQDMGVRVLYVEEDFDDTAAGRFAARSMMNVNQFYSDAMSEDIRRGLMDNAEKCMVNGSLPFGYRRSKDGYYEIDPEKAEIVREIFKRFLHEESFADIGRDLNGRGIRTKRGNTWNKNSFHRILSNDTCSGLFMEQTRITKEMRNADILRGRSGIFVRPRFLCWENVPGAFSSGEPKGEDFRIVLEEIVRIGEILCGCALSSSAPPCEQGTGIRETVNRKGAPDNPALLPAKERNT